MFEKITFFVFSNRGSPVKRGTVSKAFLRFLGLLFTACLIFVGYIVYDYYHLKNMFIYSQGLQSKVATQSEEIISQRKQIQTFANVINELKSNLVELNTFEKKIRIIANLEKTVEQRNLFGVGGSVPDDLDATIDLKQRHNSLIREMHEQVEQLDQATTNQAEGFDSLFNFIEGQRNLLACTPAISPSTGWITSRFGYRISPFTGQREFHKGVDIASRKGTPIIASADGIVSSISFKGQLGRVLIIDHGHGMVTRYAHIDKALKKRGEPVKRGETIALVGSSGRTTGPHLHYEVHLNGIPMNPARYILN